MAEVELRWVDIERWRYPDGVQIFVGREQAALDAWPDSLKGRSESHSEALNRKNRLELDLCKALARAISDPGNIAYGRKGDTNQPITEIQINRHVSARHPDPDLSGISLGIDIPGVNTSCSYEDYYDVCIVPLLAAPTAAAHLSGLLDQVLVAHVWGDTEVKAETGHLADRIGKALTGDASLLLSLDAKPDALANVLKPLLDRAGVKADLLDRAASIVADRLARLFLLLATGKLSVYGRDQDGTMRNIPPTIWRRRGAALCLSAAAIYQADKLLWSDLFLGTLAEERDAQPAANSFSVALSVPDEPTKDDQSVKGGRPSDTKRLRVLDQVLADLIADHPKFKSLKEFDRFCAQTWLDANLPIGNQSARDRDVPVGATPTDLQIRAAGEWIDDWLPSVRKAMAGRWGSGDQYTGSK